MNSSRPSFNQFIQQRIGATAGLMALRIMLVKSFNAPSLRKFWYYWNPVFGYILCYFCYQPLRRVLNPALALLITFVVSGFIFHDASKLLTLSLQGKTAQFFPVASLAFSLIALAILLSEAMGWSLEKRSPIARQSIHSALILGALGLSAWARTLT